ncbi:uncharacterized protein LOC143214209 [Lasioglossum baleicum]|uniref:uncharacterized protein LOC143214209 n=1 Tax=Lasioglossum baleicum TaxID=434251 RepID=UPI003FCE3D4D
MKGDEEGEWTYAGGRGNSVIDYILGNEETREGVEKMEVGERIDSDHAPLTVWVKGERKEKGRRAGGGKGLGVGNWSEEGIKDFREKFGRGKVGEVGVEEDWKGLKEKIKEVLGNAGKKEKGRRIGWWDEECREEKRKVRGELRRWRKEGGEGLEYRAKKMTYRLMCEGKKKEEREKWERELEGVKTERQVWNIVNRERKKRNRVYEGIKMEEWDEHFRGILGGVEWRVRKGGESKRREEGERDIEKWEVTRVLKGLKEKKAAGGDEIRNEVWKYGGGEVEEWLWRVCNRVWRGEGWIGEWSEGIVVPIAKKGDSKKAENYRGFTLLQTAYKVYAAILAERLREEVEGKGLLPESQTGFRKGIGCVDNIYVLNYLINRQVKRKSKKMIIFFVDLKAAFDSVDREVLVRAMRARG